VGALAGIANPQIDGKKDASSIALKVKGIGGTLINAK
jgi:hypothetical protein